MKRSITIYKPLGKTPLEVIEQFKKIYPEYSDQKIGYAGRLDPMAEGILLILIGEENLKRKEYEKLPKEYEFEIVFGIETDTYDTLGIIQHVKRIPDYSFLQKLVREILPSYLGEQEQAYPPYSSPRVNGKPLFYWAREGKLDEITIPTKKITINSFELISWTEITVDDLLKKATERTYLVSGEFRQQETRNSWEVELKKLASGTLFHVVKCAASCSSGTYIRSIAHEIGQKVGSGAVAFSIKRTHVGEFTFEKALQVF